MWVTGSHVPPARLHTLKTCLHPSSADRLLCQDPDCLHRAIRGQGQCKGNRLEVSAAPDGSTAVHYIAPHHKNDRRKGSQTISYTLPDGLLADLGHLLGAELGADLMLEALPASAALLAAVPEAEARWRLQLAGGNDYELLLTMGPERAQAVLADSQQMAPGLTHIGRVSSSRGLRCRRPDGRLYRADHQGWDHFGS